MKIAFTQHDPDRIVITAKDEGTELGVLYFDPDAYSWHVLSTNGSSMKTIEIDPEAEQAFREEHQRIVAESGNALQPALLAELKGRVAAYRDEHRDMAEIGARLFFRRAEIRNPKKVVEAWCPNVGTPEDEPEGCGHVFLGELDEDGEVECPECGNYFTPSGFVPSAPKP